MAKKSTKKVARPATQLGSKASQKPTRKVPTVSKGSGKTGAPSF